MTTQYAVWTVYEGSISQRIYTGTKRECNAYIKQAIIKGAKPINLTILKVTKYG